VQPQTEVWVLQGYGFAIQSRSASSRY